jgi:hypothetical protein
VTSSARIDNLKKDDGTLEDIPFPWEKLVPFHWTFISERIGLKTPYAHTVQVKPWADQHIKCQHHWQVVQAKGDGVIFTEPYWNCVLETKN